MKKLSKSSERFSFQKLFFDKVKDEKTKKELREHMENLTKSISDKEQDPNWQKNNLEYDLRTTDWILEKVRNSDVYAQSLYAALCNNDFTKNEIFPILKEETWSCSWRYAGGIIANMQQKGDYIDWYCSGIYDSNNFFDKNQMEPLSDNDSTPKAIPIVEGVVTDEVRNDLLRLGWVVINDYT